MCVCVYVYACTQSLSHVRLFATNSLLMDCSTSGSSAHGILQAKKTGVGRISFSRESSQPRDGTHNSYIFCIDRQLLTAGPPGKPTYLCYMGVFFFLINT